jgi:glycosyltransferase involved in cell wall biosynthesis
MRKLKVFHVITLLELGGAQETVLHTLEYLNDERFDGYLVCGKGGILNEKALSIGKPVLFMKTLVRKICPCNDLLTLFLLYFLFRKNKPDIIHTNSSKAGILARLAARLNKTRVVIHTVHGFGFNAKQHFLKRKIFIWLEKFCAKFSDALIFVSKDNIETAKKHKIGNPGKYHLIRSGINLNAYRQDSADAIVKKKSLGIPEDREVILSVGNMKPQKNPLELVKVARKVIDKYPKAIFVLVGDGVLRKQTERLIEKLELQNNFKLLGWRNDIAEIMAMSKIFTLVSLWEGLPRTLIEAMKTGLVPVCYATDGVKDIIESNENGFILPQCDIDGVAKAILRLLEDKDTYDRIRRNIMKKDFSEFSADTMVKKQEELYSSLWEDKNERLS